MRIFLSLLFCTLLSTVSSQAKADLADAVTSFFQANESQLTPLEKAAQHLNQRVDNTFGTIKSVFNTSLSIAEKDASYIVGSELLRIILVVVISLIALLFLSRWAKSFKANHKDLPETKQIVLELLPWVGFWSLSMFLCEAINLASVLRHALGTCLTVLSIGFGLRQVSMVIYHLQHDILEQEYHTSFKRLAPAFVYYGVTSLIILGFLLSTGIIGTFVITSIAKRPVDLQSHHALLMIDMVWYFYLLCFTSLILALQQHHINKLKASGHHLPASILALDRFHVLGYLSIFLSYASWIAAEAGWVDPISYKLILVLTILLLAGLFLHSAIKIAHNAADTVISWFLSDNVKLMIDYTFVLKLLGYGMYGFLVISTLAYALNLKFYFDTLMRTSDYIIEKGFAVSLVIGAVFLIHKLLNKITHRIVESQVHLKRAQRISSRLFTLLLLFRNLVPTLLWVPAIVLILLMFGVDSKYILYVFALILAALVFISQNMLQDIIKGLVWIAEDMVSLGDNMTINGVGGIVEHLSFQSVALRDYAGTVHVFSFSEIKTLAHHEWDHSYAVCEIAVHHEENLDKIIEIMLQVAADLREDSKVKKHIIGPMENPGVDSIKEYAVIIKGRMKTKPGTHWDVQKEYYKNLLKAFKKARIKLPYPRREIHILSK